MEILNLSEGLTVKNYKEMCGLLGENIKEGNSKKSQEKEWRRYFDFDKDKQKYVITKIYNEPLEKNDLRLIGNSIWAEYCELILLKFLSKQDNYMVELPAKYFFRLFGMINDNYFHIDKDELIKLDQELTNFQINHFYQRTYQKFIEILYSSLRNLRNRRLIYYEEITKIIIKEIIDDKEKAEIYDASDEEKKKITNVEKEVLNQMGFKNISQVYLRFKKDEFHNKVNIILYDRYGIDSTYKVLKIIFTKSDVLDGLQETEINVERMRMNEKVVDTINEQAEIKYKNNQKKLDEYCNNKLNMGFWGTYCYR